MGECSNFTNKSGISKRLLFQLMIILFAFVIVIIISSFGERVKGETNASNVDCGDFCLTSKLLKMMNEDTAAGSLESMEVVNDQHTKSKATSFSIGETKTFWAVDEYNGLYYTVTAQLKKIGNYSYVFVEDGQYISPGTINSITDEFDNKIYPLDTNYFGSPPNIDGNQKIVILLLDIKDAHNYISYYPPSVLGYFNPMDQMYYKYSNRLDMIYIDTYTLITKKTWAATLIHEFQHLIHYNYDVDEDAFINEGLSGYAEFLGGYKNYEGWDTFGHITSFVDSPDNPLVDWDNEIRDYGATTLFILYLSEHYGGNDTIKKLVAEKSNGITSINKVLKSEGYSETFNDVFSNWIIANYLDDPSLNINSGKYGYTTVDLQASLSEFYNTYPVQGRKATVGFFAADYIAFEGGMGGTLTIMFDGRDTNDFQVTVIKTGQSTVPVVERMVLGANNKKGQISIENFGKTYDEVIVIPAGISKSGPNPPSYEYSAIYSAKTGPGHPYFYDFNYTIYDPNYWGSVRGPIKNTIKLVYDVDTTEASATVSVALNIWKLKENGMSFEGKKTDSYTVYGRSADNRTLAYTAYTNGYYKFNLSIYDSNNIMRDHRTTPWLYLEVGQSGASNEWFEEDDYNITDSNGDNKSDTIKFTFKPQTDSSSLENINLSITVKNKDYEDVSSYQYIYRIVSGSIDYYSVNWTCSRPDFYNVFFLLLDDDGSVEDFRHIEDVWLEDSHESFGREVNTTFDKSDDGLNDTFSFIYNAKTTANFENISVVFYVYNSTSMISKLHYDSAIRQDLVEYRYINWTAWKSDKYSFYILLMDSNNNTEIRREYSNVYLARFNRAPIVMNVPISNATVGSKWVYDLSATDLDGDAISYTLFKSPPEVIINKTTGTIEWVPTQEDMGNNNITVDASDGLTSFKYSFVIDVRNALLEIISLSNKTATDGVEFMSQIYAVGSDGNNITYSISTKPDDMSIDERTGMITWTPSNDDVGFLEIVVVAGDGEKTTNKTFTIEIRNKNNPPVITSFEPSSANISMLVERNVHFVVNAFDPDEPNTLSFRWYLNDTLVSVSNTYDYRATIDSGDWYFINCTVSDGELNAAQDWILHVKKTNTVPMAIIDFIKPSPATVNKEIVFAGHGIDIDGKIVRHSWRYESGQFGSSPTINISSLPPGNHTIFFKVQDDDGVWSEEDSRHLLIEKVEDAKAENKTVNGGKMFLPATDYVMTALVMGLGVVIYRFIKNPKKKR